MRSAGIAKNGGILEMVARDAAQHGIRQKQAMQMSCPSRHHAYHDPVNHVSNPCCQAAPVRTLKTANSKNATSPSRKELLWRTTSVPISELPSHDSREPLKDAMLQRANGQWPVWLLVFLALLGLCY